MIPVQITKAAGFSSRASVLESLPTHEPATLAAASVLELLRSKLADGLDHPEVWAAWPHFMEGFPELESLLARDLSATLPGDALEIILRVALALCVAYREGSQAGIASLEPLSTGGSSQSPLLQGALFFLRGSSGHMHSL